MRRAVRRRDLSIAIEVRQVETLRMLHDTFVSITDAAELAGVSKKTVERAYKKFMDHAEFGEMIEKRQHGSGYRYFVTKSFVDKCVAKKGTQRRTGSKNAINAADNRSVAALIEQLDIKDRRIDKLTEILEQKEQFSETLIRKGLNLPQGTTPIDQDELSDRPVASGTPVNLEHEKTSIVDAEVMPPEWGSRLDSERPLFPTLRRGLRTAGRILRVDVSKFI